jgi:alpha-galactosidase
VGANLALLDEATLRLLTNPDILRIDQTATASRQVLRDGDLVVWTADLPRGQQALTAFNLGESPMALDRPFASFGLATGRCGAKNAWTGDRAQPSALLSTTLEPHASVVLILEGE